MADFNYNNSKSAALMALLGKSLQQGMEAGSAGARQAMQGQQSEDLEKLKSFLQGKAQDEAMTRLQSLMQNAPEGAGASIGGASYTKGWNPATQQNKQLQGDAAARTKANSVYMSGLPKVQQVAQAAQEGLDFVNDPQNIGSLGQARTLMLKSMGMNRYNEKEAAAVLPSSLHSTVAGIFNAAGGDNSPLGDSQRAAINQFFQTQLQSANKQHQMLKDNAMNTYRSSPYMSQEGLQAMSSLGAPMDQQLTAATTKYQTLPQTKGPKLDTSPLSTGQSMGASVRTGLGNAASGIGGFLKGLMTGQASPQPTASQQGPAPTPSASFRVRRKVDGQTGTIPANEFDPSQYDKVQ